MSNQMIISAFLTLTSMGLLMIILRQKELVPVLNKKLQSQQRGLEELHKHHVMADSFRASLEQLLGEGRDQLQVLEASLTSLGPKIEEKKTNNNACQAEKKTIDDEVAGVVKEEAKIKADLEAMSDSWKREINALNAELTGHRAICDHVKDDPLARKLCGTS